MSADSERALHGLAYDSAAAHLRAACRVGGWALVASPLLPFEAVAGKPVFIWQVVSELHPATVVAALAPAVGGAILLSASRLLARPSLLAMLTLLVLGTCFTLTKLGADAAAWDVAALPESLNRRIELYVLGIAFSGAALRLLAADAASRASRGVAVLAVVAGLGFGLWPGQGEAPLQTCWRFARALLSLPDLRLVLGYGLIFAIAVFPLMAAATALTLALTGRGPRTALVAEFATFGAPGLLFALALQKVLATFGDTSVVVTSALSMALAALLALSSRAIELTALWVTGSGASSDQERAPRPRYFAVVSSGIALLILTVVLVLSRPVRKGIAWQLGPRSQLAERVFGELMPRWAAARARWGVSAKSAASAAELAEARAAGNELLRASRELSPAIGLTMTELVTESSGLDLAGRRWFRLIESVNEASRGAQLPYYLDPNTKIGMHAGQVQRLFLVHPYRIEAVRPARARDVDYALLAVRRLGEARDGHDRLGFSRDHQPFALVVLDEIEPYAASLGELARREPPSCFEQAQTTPLLSSCGKVLQLLAPSQDQVRRLVERHELQHQIDGPELARAPKVLEKLDGYDDAAIDEVNRELSAYLSELSADRVSPKLALAHVLPFVAASRGSALRFVVELQLAALSPARPAETPHDLVAIFEELAALPDEALRARAREAYARLFDTELPDVTF